MEKKGKLLNRTIRKADEGWELEADQRHGEIISQELGLNECKGLPTQGADEPVPEQDEELKGQQLATYRSLAARGK